MYQQIAEEFTLQDTMVFIPRNTKRRYKHLILKNRVCPNIDRMTLQVLWCVIHNYINLIKYTINFFGSVRVTL